jgi:hypothetical protein
MNEEKSTIASPNDASAIPAMAGSEATAQQDMATPADTLPKPLPTDTVYTRPANPSPSAAIIDPDNRDRMALKKAAQEEAKAQEAARPPKPTRGEKIFNFMDWYGIGWLGNAALSVAVTDKALNGSWQPIVSRQTSKLLERPWFKRFAVGTEQNISLANKVNEVVFEKFKGHDGIIHYMDGHGPASGFVPEKIHWDKTYFNINKSLHSGAEGAKYDFGKIAKEVAGSLENVTEKEIKLARKIGINQSGLHGEAKSMVMLLLLMSGGFLLMAPIKWLEDAKVPIVKWLDKHFGPSNPTPEQQRNQDAYYKYIEENECRQTWGSVLLSRAITLAGVITLHRNWAQERNFVNSTVSAVSGKPVNPHNPTWKGFDHTSEQVAERAISGARSIMPGAVSSLEAGLESHSARLEAKLNSGPTPADPAFQKVSGPQRLKNIITYSFEDVIYSLGVATSTFMFSRVLAPIFGKQGKNEAVTTPTPLRDMTPTPMSPAAPIPQEPAKTPTPSAAMASAPGHIVEGAELVGTSRGLEAAQHRGDASSEEACKDPKNPARKPQPMGSFRDLAAQSQLSTTDQARV